jgi:hypothetical protein
VRDVMRKENESNGKSAQSDHRRNGRAAVPHHLVQALEAFADSQRDRISQ